jgi:two-component system LytT family response regulator
VTEPLRVLIADDELLARKRLTRLLSAIGGVELVGECKDGDEVLARVKQGGVDVVLLDIQMPGLSGVDALALLPEPAPCVVFCTAHQAHAVQAFDGGAVDYLLKPIEPNRLQKALERARERKGQKKPAPAPKLERLAISTRQGIVLVDPFQVSHAVLDGELVTVFTAQGDFLTDTSLQELHDKLPKDRFERVHRRALLNLEQVSRLEPVETGGFMARTARGHQVEVSRQAARDLRRRLGLRKAPDEDEAS